MPNETFKSKYQLGKTASTKFYLLNCLESCSYSMHYSMFYLKDGSSKSISLFCVTTFVHRISTNNKIVTHSLVGLYSRYIIYLVGQMFYQYDICRIHIDSVHYSE